MQHIQHFSVRLFFRIFILLLCTPLFIKAQGSSDEEHVKIKTYSSFDKVHPGGQLQVAVRIAIDKSWHINSDKPKESYLIPTQLKLEIGPDAAGIRLVTTKYPKAKELQLGFSDVPVSVFEGEITAISVLDIPETIKPGDYKIKVIVDYQSCNDKTCMPPMSALEEINLAVVDKSVPVQEINNELFSSGNTQTVSPSETSANGAESGFESRGLFLSLIIVFFGGLALNLTPCVYPLIPITIGYFGGQSEGRTGKLFGLGVLYVLGMALTYSTIGVITALSGAVFGSLMQNIFVVIAISLVLVVLALSMFGVYEFKLPDALVAKAGGAKGGYLGAFFMGLTLGIVAAPCIGPFVLGLVTYVGAKGDPYLGFFMFFFLALGMGLPYLVLALFSGKIKSLPRAGLWMEAVKHIFGFVLLGMALYFLLPQFPKSINSYLLPIYMILAALYLLFLDKSADNLKGFKIIKALLSVLIIASAVYMLMPEKIDSPDWNSYSEKNYSTSLEKRQPMVIDFFADWCNPCKELDAMTFSDGKVIKQLKRFGTYKVDMTKSLSEQTEAIRKRFKIVGMPTVLLINSKGEEVHRITGFINAEEFNKLIKDVN